MVIHQRNAPVDYRLCRQTVTIYHWDGRDIYTRCVRHDAFLEFHKTQSVDKTGSREASSFLLVLPGEIVPVAVGDKVLAGEGPECNTKIDWANLIPSKVPGLVVIKSVDPKYWRGCVVHTEAGG